MSKPVNCNQRTDVFLTALGRHGRRLTTCNFAGTPVIKSVEITLWLRLEEMVGRASLAMTRYGGMVAVCSP